MNIVDVLRGRPLPGQVLQLVERAAEALPDDPAGARMHLERLGPRPWKRSGNEPMIELGFALRAHASWLLDEKESAGTDLGILVAVGEHADSLLPIVPILVDDLNQPGDADADAFANRLGGCGRVDCGHASRVEAALAILRQATHGPAIARWGTSVPATDPGATVRIAAYLRAVAASPPDGTASLLAGDHPRLLEARAYIAYVEGRFDDVMAMLPSGADLARRAALKQTLGTPSVPPDVRRAANAYAEGQPAARAMLAEHDGRWSDAAAAWRLAGQAQEAQRASVVADPTAAFDPAMTPLPVRWFAYAAGSAARPDTAPSSAEEQHNASVGAARERIRAILTGSSRPPGTADLQAIDEVERALDLLADAPSSAAAMLSAVDPAAPAVPQLAQMLTAPALPALKPLGAEWRQWVDTHPDRRPLPPPVAPLQWLVDRTSGAAPNLRQVERLRPEDRLPVMAALAQTGATNELAAAVALLERQQLAVVASSGLPELAPLGSALSECRQLDPGTRRRAALVASAALANRVARGTADEAAATEAARLVSSGISDLHPDPAMLTPEEAFRIESESLAAFSGPSARRAVGPVLHLVSGLASPVVPPDEVLPLYDDDAIVVMLLRVGRADEARSAFIKGSSEDTYLAAEIGAAIAQRHLAAGHPHAALHELASVPDPDDLLVVDGDPLERVAAAVVRDGDGEGLDQAILDADKLLEHFDYLSEVQTMGVELHLRRARIRPGSAVLDLPDLERAFEIDPTHPRVPRQLAYALVTRAMEKVEQDPDAAVGDVDRATDIFMGDHSMSVLASRIATHAAVLFVKKRRDRTSALRALNVALAIDPTNEDALAARYIMLSGR